MLSLPILLPASALTRYDSDGEPHMRMGERLLVVLRRMDWATRSEINEALELDDDTEGTSQAYERSLVSAALANAVVAGKVRVRVVARTRQYRLVEAAFAAQRPRGRGGRRRAA